MKIFVLSRDAVEKELYKDKEFSKRFYFISIYSSLMCVSEKKSKSPLPSLGNILKLQFDDVTEKDIGEFVYFNEEKAKKIHEFIETIKDDGSKDFIVHCDAGFSRSGAVGYILNEWFNKYLTMNREDDKFFKEENNHIMPNPLVVRLLKRELFGEMFRGIEVNDYEYNEDGEVINHREMI